MAKRPFLLLLGVLISSFVFSQNSQERTEEKVGKYTVKLITNNDNTFGYAIYQGDRLVEKQTSKPFFTLSSGFVQKGSAIAVGKWHANELNAGRNNKYALSLPKARELGVSEEDLQYKLSNKN